MSDKASTWILIASAAALTLGLYKGFPSIRTSKAFSSPSRYFIKSAKDLSISFFLFPGRFIMLTVFLEAVSNSCKYFIAKFSWPLIKASASFIDSNNSLGVSPLAERYLPKVLLPTFSPILAKPLDTKRAACGTPGVIDAIFIALPAIGIAASTPNPIAAPSVPILSLFDNVWAARSLPVKPFVLSVLKLSGKTPKASASVPVPSGATKASAAPPAKLVTSACFVLPPKAVFAPKNAWPSLERPNFSADLKNLLVAGIELAPRATLLARPTQPITGIKAVPNVVRPSVIKPAVPSGVKPRASFVPSAKDVTSLVESVSNI